MNNSLDKNSARSIGIMGALASMAGVGLFNRVLNPVDILKRLVYGKKDKRKGSQQPGTYRGCKKDKFAHMSRQRVRHAAKQAITEEVKAKFQLPRRILRAIVRTRVNREWLNFGTLTYSRRESFSA
jgi:hypothetical protein